jgi:Dolichyl-phosphate-mannose-protein mannosyltransferase
LAWRGASEESHPSPESVPSPIPSSLHLFRLALLVPAFAFFLLPGWMLGRILKSPLPAVTAFLGSAALLFNLVLLLDAARLPIGLRTVGCAFAAATGAVALLATRRSAFQPAARDEPVGIPRGLDWIWLIPPALALVSIAARTLIEPLAGYDNAFRWDYLARLILSHHSLGGYPPIRAQDFDLYAWCDGIPPLAPILNFGLYAVAGAAEPRLIALRAVAEFLLVACVAYRFARDLWGRSGGWAALAALGTCTLFTWGVAIEQETGLTAIALAAMVYFIERPGNANEPTRPSAAWAGAAAGVGAISREYGLYFILLGILLLLVRKRGRLVGWFVVPALAVASPWYLRNWIKTGDPVFPAMGRIFPTNAVHVEIMRDISNYWGLWTSPVSLRLVPLVLLVVGGSVGVLGSMGLVRARFRCPGIGAAILLIAALWVWSMPETAGGWNYSMRVLLPAAVLCAVLAGWVGAIQGRSRIAWALLLVLLSVDSARRAWLLPDFPFSTPWTTSFSEWREHRAESDRHSGGEVWAILVKVAQGRFIVVDSPGLHVAITSAGGHPLPFMSPRFAPALDSSLSVDEAMRRLRRSNVRFITFSIRNPVVDMFIQRHATLRALANDYEPVSGRGGQLIFDLEFLSKKQPGGAGPPAP